jgi:hypothetical protein
MSAFGMLGDASRVRSYVDTRLGAKHLNMSEAWMRKLRMSGDGRKFYKFGKAVRYKVDELDEWARTQSKSSTSEGTDTSAEPADGDDASISVHPHTKQSKTIRCAAEKQDKTNAALSEASGNCAAKPIPSAQSACAKISEAPGG